MLSGKYKIASMKFEDAYLKEATFNNEVIWRNYRSEDFYVEYSVARDPGTFTLEEGVYLPKVYDETGNPGRLLDVIVTMKDGTEFLYDGEVVLINDIRKIKAFYPKFSRRVVMPKRITDLYYIQTAEFRSFEGMFASSCIGDINKDLFDTRQVTNMSRMFQGCLGLQTIDLSGWKTNRVTDIDSMFQGCVVLNSLNISGWDTSNVTNMQGLFYQCRVLKSLNIDGFDTRNTSNMAYMFKECGSLTSLNLKSWDTSNAVSMAGMFDGCSELTSLGVWTWDTRNVIDMSYMFNDCSSLSSLNLSRWNTGDVRDMRYMFSGCSGLERLNLSNFKTKQVSYFECMFKDAAIVSEWYFDGIIDEENFILNNYVDWVFSEDAVDYSGKFPWIRDYNYAFCKPFSSYLDLQYKIGSQFIRTKEGYEDRYQFKKGSELDLDFEMGYLTRELYIKGDFNVPSYYVANPPKEGYVYTNIFTYSNNLEKIYLDCPEHSIPYYERLFFNCVKLKSVYIKNFNRNVTSVKEMFRDCRVLEEVNVSDWDTSNVTNMGEMFRECYSLKNLDISNWNTGKVTNMESMFSNCESLESLDISSWDVHNVYSMEGMFSYCYKLASINVSNWNTTRLHTTEDMFLRCEEITSLDLSGWDVTGTHMMLMLAHCTSLNTLNICNWDTTNGSGQNMFFNTPIKNWLYNANTNFTLTEKHTGYSGTFPWNK